MGTKEDDGTTVRIQASTEKNHQRDLENVDLRLGVTTEQGSLTRNESYQAFNSDSSWTDSSGKQNSVNEQGDIGKILSELRELQQAHLAFIDSRNELLQSQITENSEHRDAIIESTNRLTEQIIELLGEENDE